MGPEGWDASPCQISAKPINSLLRYRDFSIIQDGGRLPSCIIKFGSFLCSAGKANMQNKIHQNLSSQFFRFSWPSSWMLKILKFRWLFIFGVLRGIAVPAFAKIGQSIVDIAVFRFFKMVPSWIFKITGIKLFWLMGSGVPRCIIVANFVKNQSNHCRNIVIFLFFKMAAVRHLGFVRVVFGPPTNRTWWSLSLCKIWKFQYLACLAWQCLFMPQKYRFWENLTPKWVTVSMKPQKSTSLHKSVLSEPFSAKLRQPVWRVVAFPKKDINK